MKQVRTLITAALLLFCIGVGVSDGATLFVGPSETYTAIQPALDAVVAGDTVIVRDGVYRGLENKHLDFNGKAIALQSENGPGACMIDCEGDGGAFSFHSGETSDALVQGFTITNGEWDAAIRCEFASPTINDCVISGNTAGGLYCENSSLTINNCSFISNQRWRGAAIDCWHSSLAIEICVFNENDTTIPLYLSGSVALFNSFATITNSSFEGNSLSAFSCEDSAVTIIDTSFISNAGDGLSIRES